MIIAIATQELQRQGTEHPGRIVEQHGSYPSNSPSLSSKTLTGNLKIRITSSRDSGAL
jgi:hypothetical protein